MRYFLIALLVLGAAVALIPDLRERIMPTVHSKIDERRAEEANARIQEVRAVMRKKANEIPPPAGFKAFVDRGLPNYRNAGTDPWGTPYYLKRDKFNAWVGSAGPDKLADTSDDILSKAVPLPDNRYQGRRRR